MSKKENIAKTVLEYAVIIVASAIYGFATVMFVFPSGALLGGTTGIAMILSRYLPLTSGNFSVMLNVSLIVIAFIVLGKGMAFRTFVGSAFTTFFIGIFEPLLAKIAPVIKNSLALALLGAFLIAIASGMMFYVNSSSGGTDILALIVKKFANIRIGRALLITDVLIVVLGGFLFSSVTVFLVSALSFAVKIVGIDLVIFAIKRVSGKNEMAKQ